MGRAPALATRPRLPLALRLRSEHLSDLIEDDHGDPPRELGRQELQQHGHEAPPLLGRPAVEGEGGAAAALNRMPLLAEQPLGARVVDAGEVLDDLDVVAPGLQPLALDADAEAKNRYV